MPVGLRVLVHALSAPPGYEMADKDRFLHREAYGWGMVHATGCVADVALLLVADQLCLDSVWVRGTTQTQAYFRDPDSVVLPLEQAGRIVRIDARQAAAASSDLITQYVSRGLRGPRPWLSATQECAEQWAEQDALAQQVWESIHANGPTWRDVMRQVGLGSAKHNYRNQRQAVVALLTLMGWHGDSQLDPAMFREAIGRELLYLYTKVCVAASAEAVPHDWADFLPLYRLLGGGPDPILSFRVPSLSAADPGRVVELLAGSEPDAARRLVLQALNGDEVRPADIERELLRVVPREFRAPLAFRQLSFYSLAPDLVEKTKLPHGGAVVMSRWCLTQPRAS